MSRGFFVGQFSGDETLYFDAREFFASEWCIMFTNGTLGGGTVAIEAGYNKTYAPLNITGPSDGGHTPLVVAGASVNLRHYRVSCGCSHFRFVMTGSTAPATQIWMWPEMQPRS